MAEDKDKSTKGQFDNIDLAGLKSSSGSEYLPFNPELDMKFPIQDLLTKENIAVVTSPEFTGLGWISLFRNSPARNIEAEIMMGTVVNRSLAAGQWVDIPVREDESMAGEISGESISPGLSVDFSNVMLEFTRGGGILVDKGLMTLVTDDDGGQKLKPTDKLVTFIWDRTKQFSPRREEINKP